jgi:hypothetical protein
MLQTVLSNQLFTPIVMIGIYPEPFLKFARNSLLR